jgi:predicted phosphodiesterase
MATLLEIFLLEKKNEFEKLKDNQVQLSKEEREEVMKAKAVWHHGPNGEETSAVWKSKNKDGSFIYVTHTHRAYNTAKTLKAAINKYHKFIKSTA